MSNQKRDITNLVSLPSYEQVNSGTEQSITFYQYLHVSTNVSSETIQQKLYIFQTFLGYSWYIMYSDFMLNAD
jgi:hypothetical protein